MELACLEAVLRLFFELTEALKNYFFIDYQPKSWAEAHGSPSPNRPSAHAPESRRFLRNKHATKCNANLNTPIVYIRPATPLDRIPSAVVPRPTTDKLAPPPEAYKLKKARMMAEQFNELEGPIAQGNGATVTGSGSQGSMDRDEYLKCMTTKVEYKRRSVAEWGKVRALDAVSVVSTGTGGTEAGERDRSHA